MGDGIETLPPAILLDILIVLLNNGQLRAVDLVSLEQSSSMFRAPSGIEPYESMSIIASAARQSCQMHPGFKSLPLARSELLARCEGNWKLVLHFLEYFQRSSGRSTSGNAGNNVLTAAGTSHSLIVNEKGELHASRELETPELISLLATSRRIAQISSTFGHAAFVTEIGQVYTFGENTSCCCGVGESGQAIFKPTHVTTLQGIPCQQVATGNGFTLAITRAGEVYSWGNGFYGQLGHGDTQDEFRPRKIEQFDGPDPVVQVSAGFRHALAVTKLGQLFTWGRNFGFESRPNRVEHGGFGKLFIASAAAGHDHCAAIDTSGRVYTWGAGTLSALGREDVVAYQDIPLLVDSLKGSRAIQVVARTTTCVLLDNGTIHCFGHLFPRNWGRQWQPSHGRTYTKSYVIDGHNVHSIACGLHHSLVVTEKGSIFGFGFNSHCQLGVNVGATEPLSLITIPIEVFTAVTGLEIDAELSDGGELGDER